jgi:hypothetical protein
MIFSSAIELLEFPQVLEIIAKLSASEPGAVQVRN